jgi:hypothetical protein
MRTYSTNDNNNHDNNAKGGRLSLFSNTISGGNKRPSLVTDVLSPSSIKNTRSDDVDLRREHLRNMALRNKRSIGVDSLKSLVPSMMDLDITARGSGDVGGKCSVTNTENKENAPPPPISRNTITAAAATTDTFTEQKKEPRWSLGGLW